MNDHHTNAASLQNELAAFQKSWNSKAPEGLQQKFENGIAEIEQINHAALKVGDKAPHFELNNALGKPVKLAALLNNGHVILSWYRGGWCPYCNF